MSENFRIAVELALVDANFRAALSQLTASLLSVRRLQGEITTGFEQWKPALLGAVSLFASYEIGKSIMSVAQSSKELLNVQQQLVTSGVEYNKVLEVTNKYYNVISKRIPTATPERYLKSFMEMRSITGPDNDAKAMELAEKAIKADDLLNNLQGKKPKEGTQTYYDILRSSELKGIATNDTERERLTDEIFRDLYAFGGKLTSKDMINMARQGGTAWKDLSLEGKISAMRNMAVLGADLGGSRAGTALKDIETFQMGGRNITKQQEQILTDAGILDTSKLHNAPFGQKWVDLGGIKGALQYQGREPQWIHEVIAPALRELAKKKKAEGMEGTEDEIFENLVMKAFRNRGQQRFASMFSDPGFLDQISKDSGLADKVKGINEAYEGFKESAPGVEQQYEAQKKAMWEAVGGPFMKEAIPVMQAITSLFQEIGRIANNNPKIIEGIAIGLGALAAALAVTGIGLVIAAIGAGGWLVAGITALISAVALFKQDIWWGLTSSISALINLDVKAISDNLFNFGKDLISGIIAALQKVVTDVNAWITKQFTFSAPTPTNPSQPGYRGPAPEGPMVPQTQKWEPGATAQPKVIQISHQANLNGEVLARSVAAYLAEYMEHPRQAPYFDGLESYTAPDHQPIST